MRALPLFAAATALGMIATPAAAQYYPYPPQQQQQQPAPYPGQPGYGYPQQGYGYPQQQGGLGGIIEQFLGGNRYATTDRMAVNQCANAAQAQAARQYRPRYAQNGYGQPYGYSQEYAGYARVTAITNVERRNNRAVRVNGLIDTGANAYAQPYGRYPQQAYAGADLSFRCTVDSRGRVTNLRFNRVNPRRY